MLLPKPRDHVKDIETYELIEVARTHDPDLIDILLDNTVYLGKSQRINKSKVARLMGINTHKLTIRLDLLKDLMGIE